VLSGSARIKAACRMLMKLIPDVVAAAALKWWADAQAGF